MIEYVTGDFFDFKADIRVNTVNCVGVMGAGVALQFKNRYPDMFKDYLMACQQNYVQIGKPHVWHENKIFEENPSTIINFPTKKHWKNPSEYSYVEEGLKWLKNFLSDKAQSTITLPALGCGHGGLDWDRVKVLIERYLNECSTKILVFEPHSSTRIDDEDLNEEYLNSQNITRILPNEISYPTKLKGRSAEAIYLKGDKSILNEKLLSIIVNSKASDREKEAVLQCLEVLLRKDIVFFLGYNSSYEIDIVKHLLQKRAKLLISLPYGIAQLKIRKDLEPFWDMNLITLVTLNKPKQTWKINQSINALKFRIKLSNSILISNHEVQTLNKFEKDLIDSESHIFYINYWNETNDFYSRLSAKKIGRDRETYSPNVEPILQDF